MWKQSGYMFIVISTRVRLGKILNGELPLGELSVICKVNRNIRKMWKDSENIPPHCHLEH